LWFSPGAKIAYISAGKTAMDIRFPSVGIADYQQAQAAQAAPMRQNQGDQDPKGLGIGSGSSGVDPLTGKKECQACKNRKYMDGSGDSTVSFQTPTKLSPAAAEVAVRSHEQQHVTHEQARAREEGRVVVSQQVQIHYAICPECGRMYVAGGTTTTVTRPDYSATYSKGPANRQAGKGQLLDAIM
jgi:hypothetical protein